MVTIEIWFSERDVHIPVGGQSSKYFEQMGIIHWVHKRRSSHLIGVYKMEIVLYSPLFVVRYVLATSHDHELTSFPWGCLTLILLVASLVDTK